MSDLELVKEDVERYYKEQDEKGYNMVKDLRNSNLFNFETVLKVAAMYHATKRMEDPTSDEPALNIDLVSESSSVSKLELSELVEDHETRKEYIKLVFKEGTEKEINELVNRIQIK